MSTYEDIRRHPIWAQLHCIPSSFEELERRANKLALAYQQLASFQIGNTSLCAERFAI
jgi:hypothetical protein